MEIDKLTEQILEITNNSDYGWIDLDSADADRIRVALTQAMNYIPCCTELNPDFAVGEQVLLTKRTVVSIETFCEDGMIEIEDNNEYYKVDKEELSKRV